MLLVLFVLVWNASMDVHGTTATAWIEQVCIVDLWNSISNHQIRALSPPVFWGLQCMCGADEILLALHLEILSPFNVL